MDNDSPFRPGKAEKEQELSSVGRLCLIALAPLAIDALNSRRWTEREQASRQLAHIGLPGLDLLEQGTRSHAPERARRSSNAIDEIIDRQTIRTLLRTLNSTISPALGQRIAESVLRNAVQGGNAIHTFNNGLDALLYQSEHLHSEQRVNGLLALGRWGRTHLEHPRFQESTAEANSISSQFARLNALARLTPERTDAFHAQLAERVKFFAGLRHRAASAFIAAGAQELSCNETRESGITHLIEGMRVYGSLRGFSDSLLYTTMLDHNLMEDRRFAQAFQTAGGTQRWLDWMKYKISSQTYRK